MCPTSLSKICITFELQLPSYHKKKRRLDGAYAIYVQSIHSVFGLWQLNARQLNIQTSFRLHWHKGHSEIHGAALTHPCPEHSAALGLHGTEASKALPCFTCFKSQTILYKLMGRYFSWNCDKFPALECFIIEYSHINKRIYPYAFSKNNQYSINLFQLHSFSLCSFPIALLFHSSNTINMKVG